MADEHQQQNSQSHVVIDKVLDWEQEFSRIVDQGKGVVSECPSVSSIVEQVCARFQAYHEDGCPVDLLQQVAREYLERRIEGSARNNGQYSQVLEAVRHAEVLQ